MNKYFKKYYVVDEKKWEEISQSSLPKFEKLLWEQELKQIENKPIDLMGLITKKDEKEVRKIEKIKEIILTLNNKVGNLRLSYIFLAYYYSIGIPDKKWYEYSESVTIKYFPNFGKEHFYLLYFFHFWVKVFYIEFFSICDSIWELLHQYYSIFGDPKEKFEKKMQKLKEKSPSLFNFLKEINQQYKDEYGKAETIRNQIVHGRPPYQMMSSLTIKKVSDEEYILGLEHEKYCTSKEIKENIEKILVFLKEVFEEVKKELLGNTLCEYGERERKVEKETEEN